MTTQQTFKAIYRPENETGARIACNDWVGETWEFQRTRSKRLEDLCK